MKLSTYGKFISISIIFFGVIILLPNIVLSQTICRRYNLSGHETYANQAKATFIKQSTTNPTKIEVYIVRDSDRLPYYHSNFRSIDSSSGGRYEYTTKIGGGHTALTNFPKVFTQIIRDGVTSSNLEEMRKDTDKYIKTTKLYINENVFTGTGDPIDLSMVNEFIIVDAKGNKYIKVKKEEKEGSDGGTTDCEVIYSCRKPGMEEWARCNPKLGSNAEYKVKGMLCKHW